jgi:predicted  nucleic acid-binding Zn-ribbon protein
LSAVERDRLLALADDVVSACEQCGRILIRDRQLN